MSISDRDRKRLWARSGNRCAICRTPLIADSHGDAPEAIVGDEAHISARSSGGPRYGTTPLDHVDTYDNLILLCRTDHKIVDDQHRDYPPALLHRIKDDHHRWVEDRLDTTATFGLPPDPVRWPVTYGRAPREATGTIDRRAQLRTVLGNGVPIVLTGGGGVGKSELAAQEFRARRVDVAVWVTATSRTAVLSAYRSAAAQLRLDDGDTDEATATRLLGWLNGTEHTWVVVLDDVADPEDVHGLLPAGANGLTVVTTRLTTSAVHTGAVRTVDVYTPEEASTFLRERFAARPSSRVLDGAEELAAELGHLPLALAHASAVIVDAKLVERGILSLS